MLQRIIAQRWTAVVAVMFLTVLNGCSDRLAEMQGRFEGTWVLESRELPNGTLYRAPQVQGNLSWTPIDSRKAYVSLYVLEEGAREETPRTFNLASNTYEISTSAITRKRHLMIRQGYRSSARLPITVYNKARTSKGKISVTDGAITISHDDGFSQVFDGDRMVSIYPGAFTDTWKRLN